MYHKEPPCEPRPCDGSERFKLECVVVCCDYGDFLRCTLPNNKNLFDRLVVVTAPEDVETQKLCEFYHVKCVVSKRLRPEPGKFCKGAGINDGMKELDGDGWVLHMDADIWLPPQTRILLEQAHLDKRMIHGIDRFNVHGYRTWEKFIRRPKLQHEAGAYIHLDNSFPLGTRVMQNHMQGWISIGFFQLWHPRCSKVREYPEGHISAGREDMMFANQWRRSQRALIPEVIGYHLESDDATMAANWSGRKTAPFEHRSWWKRLLKRR